MSTETTTGATAVWAGLLGGGRTDSEPAVPTDYADDTIVCVEAPLEYCALEGYSCVGSLKFCRQCTDGDSGDMWRQLICFAQEGDDDCDIGRAYRDVGYLYAVGAAMFVLSCCLKYAVTRRIAKDALTKKLWFELAIRGVMDLALVNILVLSISLTSQGGLNANGDDCSTESFVPLFAYALAVYCVDVLGDANALYWGGVVGFHATDYDAAKFEGLERVHGYATLLPGFAYIGAACAWLYDIPPEFWLYPETMEQRERVAIVITVGSSAAIFFFMTVYEYYYSHKHVPGWSCRRCRWSWVCNYCYQNKGPRPQHGPTWGGASAASGMTGKIFLTLAEACSILVLEAPFFAANFFLLLALDITLIAVQRCAGATKNSSDESSGSSIESIGSVEEGRRSTATDKENLPVLVSPQHKGDGKEDSSGGP